MAFVSWLVRGPLGILLDLHLFIIKRPAFFNLKEIFGLKANSVFKNNLRLVQSRR